MKKYLSLIIVVIGLNNCKVQKMPLDCKNLIAPSLESSSLFPQNEIVRDTMSKKIKLIFEQKFDDSMSVFVNEKLVNKTKVFTNASLGVSTNFISLDYGIYTSMPKITLVLSNKKATCVSFYPVLGKRIAYINFIKELWDIEMSNVIREYR